MLYITYLSWFYISECFYSNWTVSGHAIGRDAFLLNNIIPPVAKLFDDKENIVRKNANLAIEMVSETPPGRFIAVESGFKT